MSQPIKHLSAKEEEMTVEMLRRSFKKGSTAVRLFLQATPPSSPDNKPADVLGRIKELCGLAANEDVLLFEERNSGMDVESKPVDKASTFEGMKLKEAGILWVQKALIAAYRSIVKHPDVPLFLKFVQTQQVVHFRRLENPREDAFCLLL
ncbi:unnamed protein product [Closterium sp. Naga37s-1]|nr:unnamed protein product [Closterium sp. Naga37s-1]